MLRLDRAVFPVRSAAASLEFYNGVLGLALVATSSGEDERGAWLILTFAAPGGGWLSVAQRRGARRRSRRLVMDPPRYCLSTPSELDLVGWRRRLTEASVDYSEEASRTGCTLVFRDPDGLILEIAAPRRQAPRRPSRSAEALARRWLAASA